MQTVQTPKSIGLTRSQSNKISTAANQTVRDMSGLSLNSNHRAPSRERYAKDYALVSITCDGRVLLGYRLRVEI